MPLLHPVAGLHPMDDSDAFPSILALHQNEQHQRPCVQRRCARVDELTSWWQLSRPSYRQLPPPDWGYRVRVRSSNHAGQQPPGVKLRCCMRLNQQVAWQLERFLANGEDCRLTSAASSRGKAFALGTSPQSGVSPHACRIERRNMAQSRMGLQYTCKRA